MLRVEKKNCDFGPILKISDDVNTFEILFGGNGDLYFHPVINGMELYKKDKPIYFTISKVDGFLFESFERLYTKICNYDAFDRVGLSAENDISENEYQRKRDSYREYPLVNDGVISWHSDEDMSEIASVLNIRKLDTETFQLEFIKNKPVDALYMTYSIRFRNSGSTYDPFNFRFMELYNNLCSHYANEKDEKTDSTKVYK